MSAVLAVGAHPDDIELAMGGTVARCISTGSSVYGWIASVPDRPEIRCEEARRAAHRLGMEVQISETGLGKQVDELAPHHLVAEVESLLAEHAPQIVFLPAEDDLHQDHTLLARATLSALRRTHCTRVLAYGPCFIELARPRAFRLSSFVDVGEHWDAKLAAVAAHSSQFDRDVGAGWPERLELLARWYGAQCGLELAEGFEVIREIW